MTQLRLLSLDFDGTMIAPWVEGKSPVSPALLRYLEHLRREGVTIAMNTGRTLPLVEQALEIFPFRPDYALTTEREIFRAENGDWVSVHPWNDRCQSAHDTLYQDAAGFFEAIEIFLKAHTAARLVREEGRLAGVVAQNDQEMDQITEFLTSHRDGSSQFSFQRNGVYVRFCHVDYDKGTVLRGLQNLVGIGAEQTFVAGDNFNDLPMLKSEFGKYLACPVNSVEPVKETVSRQNGLVATTAGGDGVAEALGKYFGTL